MKASAVARLSAIEQIRTTAIPLLTFIKFEPKKENIANSSLLVYGFKIFHYFSFVRLGVPLSKSIFNFHSLSQPYNKKAKKKQSFSLSHFSIE
jgi:hypothetical protein